jgi:hypothetical protein
MSHLHLQEKQTPKTAALSPAALQQHHPQQQQRQLLSQAAAAARVLLRCWQCCRASST